MAGQYGRTSAMALAVLLLAVVASAARLQPSSDTATSVEFIRTSCGTTTYPQLCFSSLSAYASTIHNSPTQLADAALSVSLAAARSTSSAMASTLAGAGGGKMTPREVAAMKDCVEEMGDSVDELRRSMAEMAHLGAGGGRNQLAFQISDVQTWVSAALTEENTCTDGFAGKAMDGTFKTAVRGQILNVAHLTSNALALVNALTSATRSVSRP